MMANTISLIFNLTFLVAMSVIAGFIQQSNGSKAREHLLQGMLFGLSTIIGMMHPLVLGPGLIFDGRTVMISLCALFFGPAVVGLAAGMALGYRVLAVGGPGTLMGVLTIASAGILGLVFRQRWHGARSALSARRLWLFGLLVHAVMVLLMWTLPGGSGWRVVKQIGLPVLLAYPLATLLVGKVLSAREAEIRSNSALRESEQALAKGKAQLRTLIDTIPDLVWMKDPAGVYLECNHRFEKFFGFKKADIVGKTDYDFLAPELAVFFRDKDRMAILAGQPTANEERITFADDGHQEDLETIKTPIVGPDGTILGVLGIGRDITERKKAEAGLRQSEERFRALSDNVGEWIWEVDCEGIYRYSNAAVTQMLGYRPEELVGRLHYYDISPQAAREPLRTVVREAFASRTPLSDIVNLNYHLDGTEVWVETTGVPMLDAQGGLLGYRGSTRDITRRRKAEEALREAYQFNEQVLHSAQEGIIVYGPDLRYQVWNPYMEKLSSTPARELLGRHPLEVYPFLADTGLMGRLEAALGGKRVDPVDSHYEFPRSGASGWAIDTTAPLRNTRGEIIGVIRTMRDVTERRRAEEALKESEYFFRESQRAGAIGSYKTDFIRGKWESSGILDEIFGIDESYDRSVQGWLDIVHPDDKPEMEQYFQKEIVEGGKPFSREYRIIRKKSGEARWVHGLGEVAFDRDGRILSMIGTIQDITERKKAEAEKSTLQAQLQQAQKMESLGILVAGVAHNFNNILAIIMGTASFREQGVVDPLDQKAYATIGKVCKRGRDVVRSLMQFARPSLSNQVPFELHALIREVGILLENTTSNRVKIIERFINEPLWVNGDAGTINHGLVNLCLNAIDAMPDGGNLVLRTCVPREGWVEVSVEDDGEGMTQEIMSHVLEPFFTTKDVGKGTGLGLSMTYGVIKAHGGFLDLFSQPGQGTTVRIQLPRIPAPSREAAAGAAPAPPAPMNILLVDDEEDVRFLMKHMLVKAGAGRVDTVPGGEEALASLRSGAAPDLIILDQNMPGMDGIQTLERIRELHPDLPILVSSGQPGIQEWACFKRTKVGVISKPFDMDEIKAKLAQFTPEQARP